MVENRSAALVLTETDVDTADPIRDIPDTVLARVLGAALERSLFTIADLAQAAAVRKSDVAAVILRLYPEYFERLVRPRHLLKGRSVIGHRIRPSARTLVRRRLSQLGPKHRNWLRPTFEVDRGFPTAILSSQEGLRALEDECAKPQPDWHRSSRLWSSVISDLEICKGDLFDEPPNAHARTKEWAECALDILASLRALAARTDLFRRAFDGAIAPQFTLAELESSFLTIGRSPVNADGALRSEMTEAARFEALEVRRPYFTAAKRVFDILFSSLSLFFVIPIFIIVAMTIKLDSTGPIMFKQRRRGLNGRSFDIYKFRTMYMFDNTDMVRQSVRDDLRVTRVGYWLRRLSLDELPQFINVFRGEMSIVGPRARAIAFDDYFKKHVPHYERRHVMKPGITGLAFVNGSRGMTDSVEEMQRLLAFDLKYIENASIVLDMKILFRTLGAMFRSQNVY